jgi:hypothetical protein
VLRIDGHQRVVLVGDTGLGHELDRRRVDAKWASFVVVKQPSDEGSATGTTGAGRLTPLI